MYIGNLMPGGGSTTRLYTFFNYLWAATGAPAPAALASLAALSVASQVKSASLRPKWP